MPLRRPPSRAELRRRPPHLRRTPAQRSASLRTRRRTPAVVFSTVFAGHNSQPIAPNSPSSPTSFFFSPNARTNHQSFQTLTRSNPAVAAAVLAAGTHVHPWPALRVTHAAARTHARPLPPVGGRQIRRIRRRRQERLQRAGGGRTTARSLWHLIFTTPASSPSSPTTSSRTRAAPPRSAPTTAGSTSSRRSCACSTTPTRTSACPCGTWSSHTLKAGVEVGGQISRGSVNLACRCPVLLPSHGCCRRQAPRASGRKIRTNAWPLSRSSPTQGQATRAQQPGA
nr:uncharacterized protein LOC127339106 [Lolium perenne]